MTFSLSTGGTIGILGGGQLGRMLSVAAARLGLRCHVFDPSAQAPAFDVARAKTVAAYDDIAALKRFAESVDVVTYEFENIPTDALDVIEAMREIRPGRNALATSQDRLVEKRYLNEIGLKTAPFFAVDSLDDLHHAITTIGLPGILKTRRFGYDGKGQVRINSADQIDQAWAELAGQSAVFEGLVAFELEVSVIAARGASGSVACFDPGENLHRDGILRKTTVPAAITSKLSTDAVLMAGRILNALDYVGVMGVELFAARDGLVVNEIAPRVHNSGHWTQNGCAVDQFEQHIRAVAGWPLGDAQRYADVVMENLIGEDITKLGALAEQSGAALHLYGKAECKPGRKMGHVNFVTPMMG